MGQVYHDSYVRQPFLGQPNYTQLEREDRQPQERRVQALDQPPPIASTLTIYSSRERHFGMEPGHHGSSVSSDSSHSSRGRGAPSSRGYFRGRAPGFTHQQPFRRSRPSDIDCGSSQHSAEPYHSDSRGEYRSASRSHYTQDNLPSNNSRVDAPSTTSAVSSPLSASSASFSTRYTNRKPYPLATRTLDIPHASSSSAHSESCPNGYFGRQPLPGSSSSSRAESRSLPSMRSGTHLKSSLQPPTKRRKTTPSPSRKTSPRPALNYKTEEFVDPAPVSDASRGTLFVGMIDSCRRHPGCDLAQVNASRKRWKSQYAKKLLDKGRVVEKIFIRSAFFRHL